MVPVMSPVPLTSKPVTVGRLKPLTNGRNMVIFGKPFILNSLPLQVPGGVLKVTLILTVVPASVGPWLSRRRVPFMICLPWVTGLTLLIFRGRGRLRWRNFLTPSFLMRGTIMGWRIVKLSWKTPSRRRILMMSRLKASNRVQSSSPLLLFVFRKIRLVPTRWWVANQIVLMRSPLFSLMTFISLQVRLSLRVRRLMSTVRAGTKFGTRSVIFPFILIIFRHLKFQKNG